MVDSTGGSRKARRIRNEELVAGLSARRKLLFAVVLSLSFLAALEVAVRVTAYFIYGRSPYFLLYGLQVTEAADASLFDDDPGSGEGHSEFRSGYFKFPPSRTLHQYGAFTEPTPIRINSAGFRGPDFDPQKPPGVFRIVCMGGSSTFGFYARDDHTYPARLQQLLDERRAEGGPVAEVINTGIPHANSDHLRAMLSAEILDWDPDVITIYAGANDAGLLIDPPLIHSVFRWLHLRSALYVAMERGLAAIGGPRIPTRWPHYGATNRREQILRQVELHSARYEANLEAIMDEAERHGVRVVLILQPYFPLVDGSLAGQTYREQVSTVRAKLAADEPVSEYEAKLIVDAALMDFVSEIAEERGLTLVDNIAIVGRHPEYMASYVHLTEDGNDALARALLDALATSRFQGAGLARLR